MKTRWAVAVCMLVLFSLLSACAPGGGDDKVLNLYSWTDNFSPDVLAEFEQRYGVKIRYDTYSNNEELLAKLQAGGAQYDVIQPSDYMVTTMIKLGLLEELNKANIPNLVNLAPEFRHPPFDPEQKYAIVYTWGVTGIAYNKKYVKEPVDSWDDLWNPKYKGRVVLLNDSREVLGMALKKNGYSNNSVIEAELQKAFADLKALLPNVLAFDTDTIKQKFVAEEAWIGTVWSGDAAAIAAENPNVAFVVPKEGATIWADTLAIPKGAKHKELAETFLNFLLEPEISAKNYEHIQYSNPNEKALALHSPEFRNNPIINPPKEVLRRTEYLQDVGEAVKLYDDLWTQLKSGR